MSASRRFTRTGKQDQSGTILLVVVFIASAIAALAAVSAGRVVAETKVQYVLEDEARAVNNAYAQLHLAMNVVNNSAYNDQNHNLVIRGAIAKPVSDEDAPLWLQDPEGVTHGIIPGTSTRVYRARDYVKRLQALKGETIVDVDPDGDSEVFWVLEAAGRSGDVVRLVSALVRENEPFSSFVFFQNDHTLGVSGAPRGLIHTNTDLAFYFPNGKYQDAVSSVGGFQYRAGATPENTRLFDANPSAKDINLSDVDFAELRAKSDTYAGEAGLDAEIKLYGNGSIRIKPYTPPRYELVEYTYEQQVQTGWEDVTYTVTEQVQVGTTTETRTRQVIVGYETETYTVTVPIYEDQEVQKERQVPIYDTRETTCTRWVKVFVPYDTDGDGASGGTTVADSGEGVLGEYQWVEEEYPCTETYIAGYETETYTEIEQVQVGETTEERTREVPIYADETYTVEVPVYEEQTREVTETRPVYKYITKTKTKKEFVPPIALGDQLVWVDDGTSGTIFIDGRVTKLEGDLNGRVTVVSTDKVRITDDIRYVDDSGNTAMLYGNDTTRTYQRNPDYTGDSVLGVIAKSDVLFTSSMADKSEVNATLMSVEGRVGIDGLWITDTGEAVKDSYWARKKYLTTEEYETERAYDRTGTYRTRAFLKDSMRRIGGLISNNRIIETYIRGRNDGTAYVDSGFKRGQMEFDFNLLFNPPPNFVEIPRPVLAAFMPVLLVRDDET